MTIQDKIYGIAKEYSEYLKEQSRCQNLSPKQYGMRLQETKKKRKVRKR